MTGGGLGAQRLNNAVVKLAEQWLQKYPHLYILHTVGRANERSVQAAYAAALSGSQQGRVRVVGYTNELYKYSGAADGIVSRAGATAIAEFAVQGKACVLAPNPYLTGGHQLKNAEALQQTGAVLVINEKALTDDLPFVDSTVSTLLEDEGLRRELGQKLHSFSHPDAADELAKLLIKTAERRKRQKVV